MKLILLFILLPFALSHAQLEKGTLVSCDPAHRKAVVQFGSGEQTLDIFSSTILVDDKRATSKDLAAGMGVFVELPSSSTFAKQIYAYTATPVGTWKFTTGNVFRLSANGEAVIKVFYYGEKNAMAGTRSVKWKWVDKANRTLDLTPFGKFPVYTLSQDGMSLSHETNGKIVTGDRMPK